MPQLAAQKNPPAAGGRRAALLLAAAALLSLGAAGWCARGAAIEWWHIRRLDSPDPAAQRAAIAKLRELRSVRAAPRLLALGAGAPALPDWAINEMPLERVPPGTLALSALRDLPLSEDWYIDRFRRGTEPEAVYAARKLGSMGSRAAVPDLERAAAADDPRGLAAGAVLASILCTLEHLGMTSRSNPRVHRFRLTNRTSRTLYSIGEFPRIPFATVQHLEDGIWKNEVLSCGNVSLRHLIELTPGETLDFDAYSSSDSGHLRAGINVFCLPAGDRDFLERTPISAPIWSEAIDLVDRSP